MTRETRERLLPDTTLWNMLRSAVERHGDRPAVVSPHSDFQMPYQSLMERAQRACLGLVELGAAPGDRIAIWSENLEEWTVFFHAAARLGIVVPILPAAPPEDVVHILKTVEPTTLILGPGRKGERMARALDMIPALKNADASALWEPAFKKLGRVIVLSDEVPSGAWPASRVTSGTAELEIELPPEPEDPDADAAVLFRVGTTAPPLGAITSHRAITGAGRALMQNLEMTEKDRVLLAVSFGSLGGLDVGIAAAVWSGAAVIPLYSGDPRHIRLAMADNEPTLVVLSGSQLLDLVRSLERDDSAPRDGIHTLLVVGSIGMPDLLGRAQGLFPDATIVQTYGLAEGAGLIASGARSEAPELRPSRVGKLFPSVEHKVVDPNTGTKVKSGEAGELMLRGPSITRGYLGQPPESLLPVDAEGYLASGDLFTQDAAGSLRFVGRVADRIFTPAGPVDPKELEDFLSSRDKIRQVKVVSIPGEGENEEQVAAVVVLTPDVIMSEREVIQACAGKVASHKEPSRVFFVDELPLGPADEVLSRAVRATVLEQLEAEEAAAAELAAESEGNDDGAGSEPDGSDPRIP